MQEPRAEIRPGGTLSDTRGGEYTVASDGSLRRSGTKLRKKDRRKRREELGFRALIRGKKSRAAAQSQIAREDAAADVAQT